MAEPMGRGLPLLLSCILTPPMAATVLEPATYSLSS